MGMDAGKIESKPTPAGADTPRSLETAMPADAAAGLCVLASGSRGNCSVLVVPRTPGSRLNRTVVLIDCGLSPARTKVLLARRGIEQWEVDSVLLTLLVRDLAHPGWFRGATQATGRAGGQEESRNGGGWNHTVRMHRRHLGRAERAGLLGRRTEPFDDRVVAAELLQAGVA
jgi:hypothetical protein